MLALNADVAALLEAIRAGGKPPLEALSPAAAREGYTASRRLLQPPLDEVAAARDLTIPGPAGPLSARLFRGLGTPPDTRLPCLVYFHGGGWVLGDIGSHEGICRRLANAARCAVVTVDYRLAPEHPFPAAVEDSAAALGWMAAEATDLGIDAERIAVGGDSAGGNLAAVLALMGRDGTVPASRYQMLLYPAVDLTMASESYRRVRTDLQITAATMRYFIDHYAPDPADRTDWRASPLFATSLAGAPPALVLTCGHDPLCDEGRRYAERLEREGVAVTALHLTDQAHGILNMGKAIRATASILAFAAAAMRDAWDEQAGQHTEAGR
jgi:acetyl esterase